MCNIFIIITYLLFRLNAAQRDAYLAALLGDAEDESLASSDDSEDENWLPAGDLRRGSRNNEASDNEEESDIEAEIPQDEDSENGQDQDDVDDGSSSGCDDEDENESAEGDTSEGIAAASEVHEGSYFYNFL